MTLNEFVEFVRVNKQNRTFFHFTDTRNLPSIREHGVLSMKEIKRRGIAVEAIGGNQWSLDRDVATCMDGYVHLSFFATHAMEFNARNDGRILQSKFLQIKPSVLLIPGVLVTTDVSNQVGVQPGPVISKLEELDLEVIYTRTDWNNASVKQRLTAARRYEVLIPTSIPVEYIGNL